MDKKLPVKIVSRETILNFTSMNTKEFGFFAENIAARYLQDRDYEIIDRNYRKPWGEIDVIAKKGETIFFVEVKANRQEYADGFNPEIRVDTRKTNKIIKTATLYMEYELKNPELDWQVDIVAVTLNENTKKAAIKHIKNIASDYS